MKNLIKCLLIMLSTNAYCIVNNYLINPSVPTHLTINKNQSNLFRYLIKNSSNTTKKLCMKKTYSKADIQGSDAMIMNLCFHLDSLSI